MEIIIWFIGCGAVAYFAKERGRNPVLWGLASLVGSPLLVGVVLACQRDEKMQTEIVKTQMETQQVKERVAMNEANVSARFESIGASIQGLKSGLNKVLIGSTSQQKVESLPMPNNRFKSDTFDSEQGGIDIETLVKTHRGDFTSKTQHNTFAMDNEDYKKCPVCGEQVKKEAVKCRFCGAELEVVKMVECPFCKELIRSDAVKCKYCRSDISK
ncbi:MAG: zinc ribbon domain-containing protein [Phascolarctobacterium sp.]|nr:zinc ribbon domain-containing protein [Phascolarctobacterium sp.]